MTTTTTPRPESVELLGHRAQVLRDPLKDESATACPLVWIGQGEVCFDFPHSHDELAIGAELALRLPVPFRSETVRATGSVLAIEAVEDHLRVRSSYVLVLRGGDELLFETLLRLLLPPPRGLGAALRRLWGALLPAARSAALVVGAALIAACTAPPTLLDQQARAELRAARSEARTGAYTSAIGRADAVRAEFPEAKEPYRVLYEAKLAQLEEARFRERLRVKESRERALLEADKGATTPDKEPAARGRDELRYAGGLERRDGVRRGEVAGLAIGFDVGAERAAQIQANLAKTVPTLEFMNAELDVVLRALFAAGDLNLLYDPRTILDRRVTLSGRGQKIGEVLEELAQTQRIAIVIGRGGARVRPVDNRITRIFRLNRGFLSLAGSGFSVQAFQGLGLLNSIGSTTQTGQGQGGGAGGGGLGGGAGGLGGGGGLYGGQGGGLGGGQGLQPTPQGEQTRLELLLDEVPNLLPDWDDDASSIYVDRKRMLLLVRSTPRDIDELARILEQIDVAPMQVQIEARFLEVRENDNFDFGVESVLNSAVQIDGNDGGGNDLQLGAGSGNTFGVPQGLGSLTNGGTSLVLQGILSDPQFQALIFALDRNERITTLSSPKVTTANNSPATLAVTTNLVYVTQYDPITATQVINLGGGNTQTITQVTGFTAQIEDNDFTGIVLNVTPSVGADSRSIALTIQPVVRTQVDSFTVSQAAIVANGTNGGATVQQPAIVRPILQTRVITTRLTIDDGSTVVLGGLVSSSEQDVVNKTPFLGDIPLVGSLFSRKTKVNQRSTLYIFVTARMVAADGAGFKKERDVTPFLPEYRGENWRRPETQKQSEPEAPTRTPTEEGGD